MDERPNPDTLLRKLQHEANHKKRGKLRIFFGYAAGVGKTFAMLEHAHRAVATGRDLVIGYVEPHARPATLELVRGLETLPTRIFSYQGVELREFDVDAAIARNPDVILLDELAHSNAVGSLHTKRWQDAQELQANGIDVWTTLNVQHIESLNDIVGQVTGTLVRETIPDHVFESAEDIELIDVPPDDLIERLQRGLIYRPEQANLALQSFFKRSNLSALREMSLRQAASRVHSEVQEDRRDQSIAQPWATKESLLVCVGPSPTTARVIRTARRMASALDAKWVAASVDLPGRFSSPVVQTQISQHFRLAERLGAEVVTLSGDDLVATLLDFARARNITKILIGKTLEPAWKRHFRRSVVEQLLENSGGIDVYVIQGDKETRPEIEWKKTSHPWNWTGYLFAGVSTCVATILSSLLFRNQFADAEANRVMIFVASVAVIAYRCGAGPAIFASVLSVLVFDFFFVPPYLTFAVSDTQYLVTFVVMLLIGLLVSGLSSRLRVQIENSRIREQRNHTLYELGKELTSLYGEVFLVAAASKKLGEMVSAEVVVYRKKNGGDPYPLHAGLSEIVPNAVSAAAAEWCIEHGQLSGLGTNTLPNACALFIPLHGSQECIGAIAIRPRGNPMRLLQPDTRQLLESAANQLALALERDHLTIDAATSKLQAETEQLRSTLLSSVSHDLKTPLATIAGASSSLLESDTIDATTRKELLLGIANEASRLNRLLENILQMSRLDSGASSPKMEWHVLEEVLGSALRHTRKELEHHTVVVELPPDLPLVYLDDVLMEQVLVNLFENAAKYTPPGSRIHLTANREDGTLWIQLSDDGPGIPAGLEERIFDKFHRVSASPDSGEGSGLGLAICRAIVTLMDGTIQAVQQPQGGAGFLIRLPQRAPAPHIRTDTEA